MSPDGKFLLTGSTSSNAFIYQVDRPDQPPVELTGHSDEVTAVSWCPGNQGQLITCSDDNSNRIWRLRQKPLAEFNRCIGSAKAISRSSSSPARQEEERPSRLRFMERAELVNASLLPFLTRARGSTQTEGPSSDSQATSSDEQRTSTQPNALAGSNDFPIPTPRPSQSDALAQQLHRPPAQSSSSSSSSTSQTDAQRARHFQASSAKRSRTIGPSPAPPVTPNKEDNSRHAPTNAGVDLDSPLRSTTLRPPAVTPSNTVHTPPRTDTSPRTPSSRRKENISPGRHTPGRSSKSPGSKRSLQSSLQNWLQASAIPRESRTAPASGGMVRAADEEPSVRHSLSAIHQQNNQLCHTKKLCPAH